MGIVDKAKQAAIAATVTKALDYLEKDPETNIPKIMEMVDKVTPDGWFAGQSNAIRHSIEAKDNWYQLLKYARHSSVTLLKMPALREAQHRKKYPKRMTAMYRGQSFLTQPAHVTFTAQDAGQQSMATN